MPEKLTPARRSWNMSRIRNRDTEPEMIVRRIVHRLGNRFRLHRGDLPGKPDLVLPRHRTVIFVHGCFWHQHPGCVDCSKPQTNSSYWLPKLRRNVERDVSNRRLLEEAGWRVKVIWECETRSISGLEPRIAAMLRKKGVVNSGKH